MAPNKRFKDRGQATTVALKTSQRQLQTLFGFILVVAILVYSTTILTQPPPPDSMALVLGADGCFPVLAQKNFPGTVAMMGVNFGKSDGSGDYGMSENVKPDAEQLFILSRWSLNGICAVDSTRGICSRDLAPDDLTTVIKGLMPVRSLNQSSHSPSDTIPFSLF